MGDPGPLTEEESTLGVQTATVDTLVTNALFDTALKGIESKKKHILSTVYINNLV